MNDNTDIMARIHHTDMNAYKGYVASAIQTIMGTDSSYNTKNTAQYVNACLSFLDSDAPGGKELCDAFIGIGCLVESKLIPTYDIKRFMYMVKMVLVYAPEGVTRSIVHYFIKNPHMEKDDEHGYDVFISMLPHAMDVYQREHPYTNRPDAMELTSCIRHIGNFIEYQMLKNKAGYALNDDIDYPIGHFDNSDRYITRFHNFEIIVKHADIQTVKSLLYLFFITIDYCEYDDDTMDHTINGAIDAITEIIITGSEDIDTPINACRNILWLGRSSSTIFEFSQKFALESIDIKDEGKSCAAIYRLYEFIIKVFTGKDVKSYQEIMRSENLTALQDFFAFVRQEESPLVALKQCYELYSKNEASHEFLKEVLFME